MTKKVITIDGENFHDIEGFYIEIDRLFTKDLDWKTGHNLDAFNDLLQGGFGVHEYGEPITIVWNNAEKSRNDFGYGSKQESGEALFDIIVNIIKGNEEIELILK